MISAIISILPQIVKLVVQLVNWLHDRRLVDQGKKLAMADALEASARELRAAKDVENEAARSHAADPTDAAFDREFERRDP